jgi:hypothetical protein
MYIREDKISKEEQLKLAETIKGQKEKEGIQKLQS